MSLVSDFASSAATNAITMIGGETVTINSTDFTCVLAEANTGKEFAEGGYEVTKRLTAVCKTSALPAGTLVKKQATARSITWRVESEDRGATFTTLQLSEDTRR